METPHVADRLAQTPLAEGLDPDTVHRLADAGEVREVGRGELLIEEGVRGTALLVVLDGEVEVLKRYDDDGGDPLRLITLGSGTVLGEVGLVLRDAASATVRTTRPSSVFVLERARFEEILAARDAAAATLALALVKVLAARLQRMNQEAAELCERYAEVLAQAGTPRDTAPVAELQAFRQRLLSEWNF